MDFKGDINTLYAELHAMREELATHYRKYKSVQEDRNALSERVTDLAFMVEVVREDNARLKADVAYLAEKNEELKAENKDLKDELEDKYIARHARLMTGLSNASPLEKPASVPLLGETRLPMRSMGGGIPRDDGDGAAVAAAGGGPPGPQEWIVDKIPALHPSYAGDGWIYWKKLPDGRYMWNPRQMTAEEQLEENNRAVIAAATAERNPRWTYGSFYPGEEDE